MDRSKILLNLFTITLVSFLSSATTPPSVYVETFGEGPLHVAQGEAVYINFTGGLTSEIRINCAWDATDVTIVEYEIWVDDGTQRTSLFKERALFSTGYLTLDSTTFRAGRYGCAVWSANNTVTNSSDVVYLARPPKLELTRQEDVQLGESATFICHVEDEFSPSFNVQREIDYRCTVGNKTYETCRPRTALGWKVDGRKLVITKVQGSSFRNNVCVQCRVKGPKVAGRSSKPNAGCKLGLCYWSKCVPVLFAGPPPDPIATPQNNSTGPIQVAAIVIGSIVLLALATLVAPILLMVVFFKRTRQTHPQQDDAERRLPSLPCLGQACAPLTIEARAQGVGSSRPPSYDPNPSTPVPLPIGSFMLTVPETGDPYPSSVAMVTHNEQRHPQQAEGQDCG